MKQKYFIIAVLLLISFIAFAFNNCSKAKFNSVLPPDVSQACSSLPHTNFTKTILFENTQGQQCNWGQQNTTWHNTPNNGYPYTPGSALYTMGDTYFTAQTTQRRYINMNDIPTNAIICSFDSITSHESSFIYDDVLILSLNNYVVASTFNFATGVNGQGAPYLNPQDVLLDNVWFYDWKKIRGKNWPAGDAHPSRWGSFCAGNSSECRLPLQAPAIGRANINIPADIVQSIMQLHLDQGEHQHYLELTITGDNDPSDCQHSDITLQVSGSYVIPQ